MTLLRTLLGLTIVGVIAGLILNAIFPIAEIIGKSAFLIINNPQAAALGALLVCVGALIILFRTR
jgi:hypothetical protein